MLRNYGSIDLRHEERHEEHNLKVATTLNEWMRNRSWAIAMTVAIVITVGGLVILETARERIAAEYESALDARDVTVQLSTLESQLARLSADQANFLLTKQVARAEAYCTNAVSLRQSVQQLNTYYHRREADSAELASFTQIAALIDARIGAGAAAMQQANAATARTGRLRHRERRASGGCDADRQHPVAAARQRGEAAPSMRSTRAAPISASRRCARRRCPR